jgi:uncharacterized protein YgbK (DUF1537 family)
VLDEQRRGGEIDRVLSQGERGLQEGKDVVLYTSRELAAHADRPQWRVGRQVSDALVEVLHRLSSRPAYVVGIGGITSSDLAAGWAGVRKAQVLG